VGQAAARRCSAACARNAASPPHGTPLTAFFCASCDCASASSAFLSSPSSAGLRKVLRRGPTRRQAPLLSATPPPPVLRLAHRYMVEPAHINLSPARVTVENIRQSYITVDEDKKFELLPRVLERERPRQCLISCERKRWVGRPSKQLRHRRKGVSAMHGDLPQSMRNRIMQGLRDGKITARWPPTWPAAAATCAYLPRRLSSSSVALALS
jgi:hypothetical protein